MTFIVVLATNLSRAHCGFFTAVQAKAFEFPVQCCSIHFHKSGCFTDVSAKPRELKIKVLPFESFPCDA
jgi:hypothetical protein